MKKAKQNKNNSKENKLPAIQSNLQKGNLKQNADSTEKLTQKTKKSTIPQIPTIPLTNRNVPKNQSSNKAKSDKTKKKYIYNNYKEEENVEQEPQKEEGPRITEEKLAQLKMQRKKRLEKEKKEEEKEIINDGNGKENEYKKDEEIKEVKKIDKKEEVDKKENEENEEEEEEEEKEQEESTSTYILKYTRKSNESRESSYDRELIKSKHCLFMIEFKIIKGKKDKYLLIYCHEIAAIYFDEIYEKKYSTKDLYKENRHFRIFDNVEEAKNVVDEILNNNTTNSKKIFIDLQDNSFRLHLKITFFDKENEVIFVIPKKNINDKERIRLLPEFLKEIQIKMNHLEEENKKLKSENKNMTENELLGSASKLSGSGGGDDNDFFLNKGEINSKKNKSGNGKGYKKKSIKK
jgi:hypothetical protein